MRVPWHALCDSDFSNSTIHHHMLTQNVRHKRIWNTYMRYAIVIYGQYSEFLNVLLVRRILRADGCKTGPIFLHYEDACSICGVRFKSA